MVGPDDVRVLQDKIATYRFALQGSINLTPAPGLPEQGVFSQTAWLDLVERCKAFEAEGASSYNPFAYLYSGTQYERGRQLIIELDKWRDELANRKAPNVPEPVPVPHSDIGLAGGLGFALAAIVAVLALRELR